MPEFNSQSPVWPVGALCQAIGQALEAQFNPLRVAGEISGFARAASGHCYFSLKDVNGQLRCAMFRRAASQLVQLPRDGERVEVSGRLGIYEPRGELQFIVESLQRAGQGSLFEQFLERKQRLEAEGLFDPARKRAPRALPRGIGIVTSLGAAALHDVVTTLQRRVPHLPIVLVPASVQGEQAAPELVRALQQLYRAATQGMLEVPIDTILLVRGGGAMEDLWAFNDELLARTLAASPVPVITGIGHETDFTIADFVADLRAPTPTAAAEMACVSTASALDVLREFENRLLLAQQRMLDRQAQALDRLAARLGRLSLAVDRQQARLRVLAHGLQHGMRLQLQRQLHALERNQVQHRAAVQRALTRQHSGLEQAQLRLQALDPALVLGRGYAWLSDTQGQALTCLAQLTVGQTVRATLRDGSAELTALSTKPN